ncbi:DUF1365 domain-containing protein [Aliiglaciecola sp. SL4]|uniref:DUF1365 domain-containing protein n=1 Tax=Aliiglaciecola sp. SL4 TaxID=3239806 RepID=UPI00355BC57A
MHSALYTGQVFHARHLPKKHAFSYKIFMFWLDLDEIDELCETVKGFSKNRFSVIRFKRSDYLGKPQHDLKSSVVQRMSELAEKPLTGKVFLLGQLRMFGLYFSPVNFYYLQQADGTFSHLLAEVSNTPWNERHHYLVDLSVQQDCDKAFHVSPFNPLDMQYKWSVQQPDNRLKLALSCFKKQKHFEAHLNLVREPLNSKHLLRVLLSIPSMTIKTVVGIYWQALKLFVKGVPFYGHPGNKEKKADVK